MNFNQGTKDFTQYSIKTTEILANIFEILNKFKDCQNEDEKNKLYSELSENITNFELNLDCCSIDVNESISKLVKVRFEKNVNLNNSKNDNRGNRTYQEPYNKQMSDKDLIQNVVKQISQIKLDI